MAGQNKTLSERVVCEQEGCKKDYASKAGMKDHMKKMHQNVMLSIVQDVMNFLSPQAPKVAESVPLALSPKELFSNENEEEDAIMQEAVDDQDIYSIAERSEQIEALKLPIVPGGDWLRDTLPSGNLDNMLKQVQSRKIAETHDKPPSQKMTCVECVLGKEENRKQDMLNKANKQANKTLQKEFQKKDMELKECRELLHEKNKRSCISHTKTKNKTKC